jgi:hypothetical protein
MYKYRSWFYKSKDPHGSKALWILSWMSCIRHGCAVDRIKYFDLGIYLTSSRSIITNGHERLWIITKSYEDAEYLRESQWLPVNLCEQRWKSMMTYDCLWNLWNQNQFIFVQWRPSYFHNVS